MHVTCPEAQGRVHTRISTNVTRTVQTSERRVREMTQMGQNLTPTQGFPALLD